MLKGRELSGTGTRVGPVPLAPGRALAAWADRQAQSLFLLPAVLLLLGLSIFPLIVSLYLSLARFQLVPGGFQFRFVGLANYHRLVAGIEREHFLGFFAGVTPGMLLAAGAVGLALLAFVLRGPGSPRRGGRAAGASEAAARPDAVAGPGPAGRLLIAVGAGALAWLAIRTLAPGGRPGTLMTTLIYVVVGIAVQYGLGLTLAYLASHHLPGRRFFRVVFLLPMMITPVGIAYTFRILADLGKGPFAPVWRALGLAEVSWANDPWGARIVVMIGDIWQWTPFMFIVLLAALEAQPQELLEAAMVDGATRWQTFWRVTWPQILPVTSTLILIRMIEAFKIVDLPNVLTNGGPGTATESLTLHAFMAWRTLDIGGSAAVAYALLFLVTFSALSYVHVVHRRLAGAV